MSKKQFVVLADSIREHNRLAKFNSEKAFTDDQLAALARFCASENPRFRFADNFDFRDIFAGQHYGQFEAIGKPPPPTPVTPHPNYVI